MSEALQNCPICDSSNVELDNKMPDGWVDCKDCGYEAPLKAWQGPRKRVEELEARVEELKAQLKQEIMYVKQYNKKCVILRSDLDDYRALYNELYKRTRNKTGSAS